MQPYLGSPTLPGCWRPALSKSIPYTRGFVPLALIPSFVAARGDLRRAFDVAKLPPPEELTADQLLPAKAYYALLDEMTRQLGDRHFPARAGAAIARSGLPALRDARNGSASICEFLVRLQIVFRRTVTNAVYELSSDGVRAVLSLRRTGAADASTEKVDALNAGAFVTIFRDELGGRTLEGLTASLPDPSLMPPDILRGPALMRRKEGGIALSFPSEWLLRPIRHRWHGRGEDVSSQSGGADKLSAAAIVEERIRARLFLGPVRLTDVAADLGSSPRRLQRVLKASGTSFREVLVRQRLEAARQLLATTNKQVGTVSLECGFGSAQTFSRAFSSAFRMTPSEYRAALIRPNDNGRAEPTA